jgi:hypothetical protein
MSEKEKTKDRKEINIRENGMGKREAERWEEVQEGQIAT